MDDRAGLLRRESLTPQLLRQPPDPQRCLDALLRGMADRMAQQPLSFLCCTLQPLRTELKREMRMVFGDITDVIGHTPSDIQIRIVFKRF